MTQTQNTQRFRAARDYLLEVSHDYDRAITGFEWPEIGPTFNWAIEWFDVVAVNNDRPALWIVEEDGTETRVSFAEMSHRSDQVASWLQANGVSKGDRVIVMLGNQVELWECGLGLMKIGAVMVPSTAALGVNEVTDRVERGRVRHVIANVSDTAAYEQVPGDYGRFVIGGAVDGWVSFEESHEASTTYVAPDLASSDPLLVYFTSGTTSKPKMVEHTQTTYPVGHLSTMYWIGAKPGDVHQAISAPGWAKHAWSLLFAPWNAEATIFVYNYSKFDAAELVNQMDRAGVTTFCAPPTVWRMVIQSQALKKPHALRELLSAGEPLNPEVISQIETNWGITIRDGFGQTELTASIANSPGTKIKPGAVGRALPGVPVVLLDTITGEPSDEGEICIDVSRAPRNLMTGYLDDSALNERVFAGGFYHTGDVAQRDADGNITYVGRTDDVFKSSDFKVSPFEVESLLLEHPAVAEAAVVPAPHDTRLTVPKAYIVLAHGWKPNPDTALAILRHARDTMPGFMRVRRVEFSELPKTISGKIRRVELRQREVAMKDGLIGAVEYREEQFPELKAPKGSAR